MKKKYIIISIVVLVISAAWLYLRFGILKSKDFTPDPKKSISALDLRPALIARLQQLVKDGSNGLYILSVERLETQLSEEGLDLMQVTIKPDSAVLAKLDTAHKAPDNVLKLSFDSLHIDGIGLSGLLNQDQVNISTLHIVNPVVDIFHLRKMYNKQPDKKPDSVTLYRLLMKSIKKIKIDAIEINNGTFINHNLDKKNTITHIDRIAVNMKDILVDSSTQYDKERFLFAKTADISLKNYLLRTGDSLYFLKASSVNLSAVQHSLTAYNVELEPRGSRAEFEKKLKHRKDMFTIKTSKIVLNQVNLYEFINDEKLVVKEGTIDNCDFVDFFDNSVPGSTSAPDVHDFPQQQLLQIALPVYIQKINLRNLNIKYEEYNPSVKKSGSVIINAINGLATNITNMPEFISKNHTLKLQASGLFMNKANLQTTFSLDLKDRTNGRSVIDATMGSINGEDLNVVCEPLGFVSIKKGIINKVVAHVNATNYKGTGNLLLLYDDLHIDILKKDDAGQLKKRGLLGFVANFLLIKNANPTGHKPPRSEACNFTRDPHGSFFNHIFKTILTGALKTIGLPEKLAYK